MYHKGESDWIVCPHAEKMKAAIVQKVGEAILLLDYTH
jgi:hypothetical protein